MKKSLLLFMCLITIVTYSQTNVGIIGGINFDSNDELLLDDAPVGIGFIIKKDDNTFSTIVSFGNKSNSFDFGYGSIIYSKNNFEVIPTVGIGVYNINSTQLEISVSDRYEFLLFGLKFLENKIF